MLGMLSQNASAMTVTLTDVNGHQNARLNLGISVDSTTVASGYPGLHIPNQETLKLGYEYDARGRVVRAKDANGNWTDYEYGFDSEGRYKRTTSQSGAVKLERYWAGTSKLRKIEDANGGAITLAYDAFGEISDIETDNLNSSSGWVERVLYKNSVEPQLFVITQ